MSRSWTTDGQRTTEHEDRARILEAEFAILIQRKAELTKLFLDDYDDSDDDDYNDDDRLMMTVAMMTMIMNMSSPSVSTCLSF